MESGETSRSTVEGESVALTGDLVVEESATMGDATVEDVDRAVGAYLWRARFPDNTNSTLTIEEWGWERQRWHTFASGLEWGRFGVATDGQTVLIDPTWLRSATGAKPLGQVEVGGMMKSDRFSISPWESWYTYLRNRTEYQSLRRFAGHVRRHNDSIDLDRYLLEARPLVDGTSVSVSGELHVEQGKKVLRGTDEVPLLLTDGSFDEHRRWLRRQALRKGGIVAGILFFSVCLWFESYVPFAVLLVGLVIYLGYRFTKDAHIIIDFLRRVFRG
ncbi:hypothetical protein ACFQJ5_19400 [Halomicroarcula sp. GCM10025324]|uniref:hypothetical protein n=1 Tax=Halomicroarcula sp. GCM10025324 TaxID=3252667 RepID=UPI00361F6840